MGQDALPKIEAALCALATRQVVSLKFAEAQPQIPTRLRSGQAFDSASRKKRGFLRSR